MMGIAQKVSRDFSDAVRARGQSYFAKGRVVITSANPGEVVARVRGTAKYRVRLRLRNTKLHVSCTCPYFVPTGDPCKHLWATVLTTDARGLLPSAPVRPLQMICDLPRRPAENGAPAPPGHNGPGQGQRPGPGQGQGHPSGGPRPAQGYQGHARPEGAPQGPNQGHGPPRGRGPQNRKARDRQARGGGGPGPGPGSHWNGGSGGPSGPAGPRTVRGRAREKNVEAKARGAKAVNRGAKRLLVYVLDVPATLNQNQVVIDLARRQRRPGGDWGPLKPWWHSPQSAQAKYDPEDRELLALLEEAQTPSAASAASASTSPLAAATALLSGAPLPPSPSEGGGTRRYVLRADRSGLVEKLARAGRLRLKRTEGEDEPPTMRWDDGPPWRFCLDVRPEIGGKRWSWRGVLRRGEPKPDRMDLAEPLVLVPGLLVLGVGRAARFDDVGVMPWIVRLRHEKEIVFAEPQQDVMISRILAETRVSPSELVDSFLFDEINTTPRPCLTLRTPRQNWGAAADRLLADLEFDYDGAVIPAGRTTPLAVSTEHALVIRRDPKTESAADVLLFELGFRESKDPRVDPGTMELPAKRAGQVSRELVQAGWRVEAEGKLIRPAGEFKLAVTTGIDWFELDGEVDYGGSSVSLPDLLAAARRGESTITLSDGSVGMLPEDWLKKYGMLVDLGTEENGQIRFGTAQAALLDALLAAQPGVQIDESFEKVRQSLQRFDGVAALEAPAGFHGELRPYQREGLGWLDYLQKFGFGGILADDMGLGKTVQVLAFLQRRRSRRQSRGPALAVEPRSLVFNGIQEAAKFTPRLRVLDITGPN
ncbi:MAG: SNF2-related protein, partial [Isosphaeraceae bacterium]